MHDDAELTTAWWMRLIGDGWIARHDGKAAGSGLTSIHGLSTKIGYRTRFETQAWVRGETAQA
jgi:hypothetical protein